MDNQLLDIVLSNDADSLMAFIASNPGLDVNRKENAARQTVLHEAADRNKAKMVKFLLQLPGINVNPLDYYSNTPFNLACGGGAIDVVKVMLEDPRVDVNLGNSRGTTGLCFAAHQGNIPLLQILTASGRDLSFGVEGSRDSDPFFLAKTSDEMANEEDRRRVVGLLERLKRNPEETAREVRRELGWWIGQTAAAEIFALVVFVSDDLLAVTPPPPPPAAPGENPDDAMTKRMRGVRFFEIARKLPLELQMVLCLRVSGSTAAVIISGKVVEASFVALATALTTSS